ncbi:MAG: ABC transporter ATP-binding protein, partial [Bulleidia sp.]|nr:ABC transporter ATP-binding protein [Bulleidia sp.]
ICISSEISSLTMHISANGLTGISSLLLLLTGNYILLGICNNSFNRRVIMHMQASFFKQLYSEILHKINALPYDSQSLQNTKDTYTLLSADCDSTLNCLCDTLTTILFETIRLFFVLVYMCMLSPLLFFIYFCAVLLSVVLQWKTSHSVEKASEKAKEAEVNLNGHLKDVLDHKMTIQTNQAYAFSKQIYASSQQEYTHQGIHMAKVTVPVKVIGLLCGVIPVLAVCLASILLYPHISLEVFMGFFYLCQEIVPSQLHYTDYIVTYRKEKVSVQRIEQFLNQEEKTYPAADSQNIVFDHVYYTYPGEDTYALRDVSFTLKQGSKVAFIGESGSGKSTALKLIAHMMLPSSGSCLSKEAVFTQQFPYLFTDTLYGNVALEDHVDEKKLTDSLSKAKLGNMENREIENNGSNLSGGQRQRIALARALYHAKDILLFDESIS